MIESYVGNVGWSLSRMNSGAEPHTLDWCMEQWNGYKTGTGVGTFLTDPHRYRLRNIQSEDIIMCAIL